jgi:predicted DsbA family dithiol-disulfide isomerase
MSVVEVFAEIGCPFTHVGLIRFVDQRRRRGTDEPRLRVRSWPLEFVNGSPLAADFIAEEIEELKEQVSPELFAGFDAGAFPSTSLPGFALAAAAYDRDLATGEAVSLELRHRLFERGEDVSDPDVLEAVAAAQGLTDVDLTEIRAAHADHEEGRSREVIGSPHFFTPGGGFFCPALAIERVDDHLHITADPVGFDRFIEACFT